MFSMVIEKENIKNGDIHIYDKKDINHIVNVHRCNINDEIRVVDNEYEYIAKIFSISKKEIILKIINKFENKYSLNINIDAAISLIKNDKMNLIIQKLTELGIRNIIPIKTKRVVVKINDSKEKWNDIVKESMKQCQAVQKTNITPITTLNKIDLKAYDKVIYLYENSNSSKKITDIIDKNDKNILYVIGPEGGFDISEIEYLKSKNTYEISLGPRILRAETAAITVASIISHNYGY
ncbi:RsmE family RNA methyltransferase [Caviibacter abscessus]|uniref:RsmE family RNA methyltransferase n=1 Tax=Caviibacter abscessus TaxID=1766719 RepID=UPI0008343A78|nr:16S rRNA (uracil(1498)-N(3))-methyltransferase [Caviibacter abscessus]